MAVAATASSVKKTINVPPRKKHGGDYYRKCSPNYKDFPIARVASAMWIPYSSIPLSKLAEVPLATPFDAFADLLPRVGDNSLQTLS